MDFFDNYLINFLRDLPKTDIFKIHDFVRTVRVKKNEVYLNQGVYSTKIFYVKRGLVRGYYTDEDGEEKTVYFRWQKEFGADPACFFEKAPAAYTWSALEETEILEINHQIIEELSKRNIGLLKARIKMQEKLMKLLSKRLETFIIYSPEERFLNLLKNHPDLCERIPDKYLASFLGITPVSLSRIKKRLQLN